MRRALHPNAQGKTDSDDMSPEEYGQAEGVMAPDDSLDPEATALGVRSEEEFEELPHLTMTLENHETQNR